jgi:hypothetical protein
MSSSIRFHIEHSFALFFPHNLTLSRLQHNSGYFVIRHQTVILQETPRLEYTNIAFVGPFKNRSTASSALEEIRQRLD